MVIASLIRRSKRPVPRPSCQVRGVHFMCHSGSVDRGFFTSRDTSGARPSPISSEGHSLVCSPLQSAMWSSSLGFSLLALLMQEVSSQSICAALYQLEASRSSTTHLSSRSRSVECRSPTPCTRTTAAGAVPATSQRDPSTRSTRSFPMLYLSRFAPDVARRHSLATRVSTAAKKRLAPHTTHPPSVPTTSAVSSSRSSALVSSSLPVH